MGGRALSNRMSREGVTPGDGRCAARSAGADRSSARTAQGVLARAIPLHGDLACGRASCFPAEPTRLVISLLRNHREREMPASVSVSSRNRVERDAD